MQRHKGFIMKMMDLLVIENSIQWLKEKKVIWLCTVLHTYGSAPRSPGSLFVATENNEYVGSLSGGCIEEDFLLKISDNHFQNKSEVITYGASSISEISHIKLPCNGTIDVLIERLEYSDQNIVYLEKMAQALMGKEPLTKSILIGEYAKLTENIDNTTEKISRSNDNIVMHLQSYTTVFIACLSAVAFYCIEFASALGFSIIVCEDREEELRQLKSQPHLLEKVELYEVFPMTYLEDRSCTANTAILSLTHDPRIDDLTMMEAVRTSAFYIGAMGSSRNSHSRLQRLKEVGLSDEQLSRIKAPIGLPIGSKTPAEIALSIVADIVQTKNLVA